VLDALADVDGEIVYTDEGSRNDTPRLLAAIQQAKVAFGCCRYGANLGIRSRP
jgi:hypothetical protein